MAWSASHSGVGPSPGGFPTSSCPGKQDLRMLGIERRQCGLNDLLMGVYVLGAGVQRLWQPFWVLQVLYLFLVFPCLWFRFETRLHQIGLGWEPLKLDWPRWLGYSLLLGLGQFRGPFGVPMAGPLIAIGVLMIGTGALLMGRFLRQHPGI